MRIIAGEYRSRRLAAPRGDATRPTSDRLRETLFNVLGPRVAGARVADLYAGSGAVGLEALSRGAAFCRFVERAPAATQAIRANLASLRIMSGFTVDTRPVARALADLAAAPEHQGSGRFDLVFLDPPYEAAAEYTATLGWLGGAGSHMLAPGALVIAEHARRDGLPSNFGILVRSRLLKQGDAALSFYAREQGEAKGM